MNKVLPAAQFNIKNIVANIDLYKTSIARRKLRVPSSRALERLPLAYECFSFYSEKRRVLVELRNILSRARSASPALEPSKWSDLGAPSLKEIKSSLKLIDPIISRLNNELMETCEALPNLIEPRVKDDIELVELINLSVPKKSGDAYDHKHIMEKLKLADFTTAATVSGTSWYYLLGQGALLEQALVQYALKLARKSGFLMCTPPSMVRTEFSNACGFKPRDTNNEQQTYSVGPGLVMTGTAEIPLAGLSARKTFVKRELPSRLVGVSRSYRAEAGARGRDTRGLYRVHEFTKVELFVTCDQESSDSEFQRILQFQKHFVESLGLPARVINIPADDLGAPAYCKYDIEAWMPGRGSWGELTSTSICLDYQTRRLHTRYVEEGRSVFAHTLNGTAVAVPRMIVAIVENGWDGEKVKIPDVLREYMDGEEYLGVVVE